MKQSETSDVVVVFPWVPDTPIVSLKLSVSFPRNTALSQVFMPNLFASTSSGSSLAIAAVYTTKSAFFILSRSLPNSYIYSMRNKPICNFRF